MPASKAGRQAAGQQPEGVCGDGICVRSFCRLRQHENKEQGGGKTCRSSVMDWKVPSPVLFSANRLMKSLGRRAGVTGSADNAGKGRRGRFCRAPLCTKTQVEKNLYNSFF
mmetsp:Transcript_30275/g.59478  ORF Transcript_30275/g.59478 Transcript_30275/m.59478 type:complete len:111 (+) Transcript_30275:200-532(+)